MNSTIIILPVCFLVGVGLGILKVPLLAIALIGGVVGLIIHTLVSTFTKGVAK
jgi:hypothetical protein